jgi:hypothetical protein
MSMTVTTKRWPRGTGQWSRTRILIVATNPGVRDQLVAAWSADHDVVVAQSPLEVIRRVESDGPMISTVVIADCVGSVARKELAEFITSSYPFVRVLLHDAEPAARPDYATATL